MKSKVILLAALSIAIAGAVFLFTRNNPKSQLHLLKTIKPVKKDSGAALISTAIEKQKLKSKFLRSPVNVLYPESEFIGTLKLRGEFFHSLYSVGGMGFRTTISDERATGISFSIYNPKGSKLKYQISKAGARKKILFSTFYKGPQKIAHTLDFQGKVSAGDQLIFETKGEGIGAWINPIVKKAPKKSPRIVVIVLLDTLRWDHTSVYGYHRETTPELKKLLKNATLYENSFSTTSWTLPAHVSLFSGREIVSHKVAAPGMTIPAEIPLIGEYLQNNGFVTAAFTGGGFINGELGFARGFMEYSNNPGNIITDRSPEKVLKRFKSFLAAHDGSDMFVFLHSYQIHTPYNKIPKTYATRFNPDVNTGVKGVSAYVKNKFKNYFQPIPEKNRQNLIDLYDACIYYSDKFMVGGLVEILKEKGLYDRSMIVVTSDHGEEFYDHGSWEHGHSLHNELVKIPLVIKHFNQKSTKREQGLISIVDLPAIILDGLGKRSDQFPKRYGSTKRRLSMHLPVSPIVKSIPLSAALVSETHKLIFTDLKNFKGDSFTPPPDRLKKYKLYGREDPFEKKDLYSEKINQAKEYIQKIQMEIKRIKQILKRKMSINDRLRKKLKTLGYLGDDGG